MDYPLEDTSSFLSTSDFDPQANDQAGLLLDSLGPVTDAKVEVMETPAPAATRSSVIVHHGPTSPSQQTTSPHQLNCLSTSPGGANLLTTTSPPSALMGNSSPILVGGSPQQRSPTTLLAGPAPALQVACALVSLVCALVFVLVLLFIVFVLLPSSITGGERAKIGASRSPGDLDRAEEGSGHHGECFHHGECDHLGQQTT